MSAPNPASQNWVTQQLQPIQQQLQQLQPLTASNWAAVCTSATLANGCFGNVSSVAYQQLDTALGGFSTYTNINTNTSVDNSVYMA